MFQGEFPYSPREPTCFKVSSHTVQATLHVPRGVSYMFKSRDGQVPSKSSGRRSSPRKLLDLEFPCSCALCGKG